MSNATSNAKPDPYNLLKGCQPRFPRKKGALEHNLPPFINFTNESEECSNKKGVLNPEPPPPLHNARGIF